MKSEDLHIGRMVRLRRHGPSYPFNGFICPVISAVMDGYVTLAHEDFPCTVENCSVNSYHIDSKTLGWRFCRFPLEYICLKV